MKLPRSHTKPCVAVALVGFARAGFVDARQRGEKSHE